MHDELTELRAKLAALLAELDALLAKHAPGSQPNDSGQDPPPPPR